MSRHDLTPPSAEERRRLEAGLTAEQRHVLLEHGTERPFCGAFVDQKKSGTYSCRLCGLPLFRATEKFNSGTGWPSFTAPWDDTHLRYIRDTSCGMVRSDIRCARCDSHQGHVFDDGPPPTGQRYCINSISLTFSKTTMPSFRSSCSPIICGDTTNCSRKRVFPTQRTAICSRGFRTTPFG